jgi:uncharacterized membrane protein
MEDRESRAAQQGEEGITTARIESFSDAVFAVAITLLILNITVPQLADESALGAALRDLTPHFVSFFISFVVIGLYWMAHHAVFRYIRRHDRTLLWLNLFFLLSIVVMPFSTNLLGEYGTTLAVVFYATNLFLVGVMLTLIWVYASSGHRFVSKELDAATIRHITLENLNPPLVFLVSIGIAFASPSAAQYFWIVIPVNKFLLHSLR